MMNKKAAATMGSILWKQWAEAFFVVVMFVGFVISITLSNPWLNYLVIFLAGLWLGRTIYVKKGRQPAFPYLIIALGFLIGFMLVGMFDVNISEKMIVASFVLGSILSYYVHKKGYVK